MPAAATALVLAIATALGSTPAYAQTTSGNSAYWRNVIAAGGDLPRDERLVVIAPDGRVVAAVDGEASRVVLPPRLNRTLIQSPELLTLVHNHPTGASLSGSDLAQLGKPGVGRIIAVGHDGSLYEAASAAGYKSSTFATQLYPALFRRMLDRFVREAEFGGYDVQWLLPHVCHTVAATLDRAGIISYQATFGPHLAGAYGRFADVLEYVIASEAKRIERHLAPGTLR
jgi:hypothetical protein